MSLQRAIVNTNKPSTSTLNKKVVVMGLAGGSGSGKTTVARKLVERFVKRSVLLIPQDAYYKDMQDKSLEERMKTNYDHPLAFDNELLAEHIRMLLGGEGVDQPIYNYVTHSRSEEVNRVEPAAILLLEGIMVLEDRKLRDLMDIKVYVETAADERFIRRLQRDMSERGRSLDSVIDQYLSSVRPMHQQFVQPSKRYADVIIPQGGKNEVAIDLLASKMESILLGVDV